MVLINNQPNENNAFSTKIIESGLSIYEVIRVFEGHPIFLRDNLVRLANSLTKSNIDIDIENLNIPEKLRHFILLEKMTEGIRTNIFSEFPTPIRLKYNTGMEFQP